MYASHPCSIFGHVADGSLHVELFDEGEDDVLNTVVALGGAVSAEHGVGRVKTGRGQRSRGGDGGRDEVPEGCLGSGWGAGQGVLFGADA